MGEFEERVRKIMREKADNAKRLNNEFAGALFSLDLERYKGGLDRFPDIIGKELWPGNAYPSTKGDE